MSYDWKRSTRRGAAALALGLVVLAGSPGRSAAQSAGPPVSLTLEQAVERALEHNPQVVQAAGTVRTAEAGERSALGAYLPSLSASASSSLSGTDRLGTETGLVNTGLADSYTAGLSASWDVYTGGRRGAEKDQAEAQSEAAEATLSEQQYAVTLSTKREFYDVLRAQELVEVAQARVKRSEEGIAAAQRRMNVGSATRSDVLRAELELNTARQSLLEAQNQEAAATYALGRLVGEDGPVGATAGATLAPESLGVADTELIEQMVAASPTVQAAEASVRAADAGTDVARSQYLPTVRLTTGYAWSTTDAALSYGQTGWQVGLGVSMPLFDGFQREESTTQARVQEEVAEAKLADSKRAVRADAEKALGTLRLAESKIELAGEAVTAAEEDLRVQQERYRLGATTILDLLTSQEALVEAQTNQVTARFDYQVARAELEALAGREL